MGDSAGRRERGSQDTLLSGKVEATAKWDRVSARRERKIEKEKVQEK